MDPPSPGDVTRLLHRSSAGDREAADELLPLIHGELRRLAAAAVRRGPADPLLQVSALVNEAWLKLFGRGGSEWRDRGHFLAVASRAMRSILVDQRRNRGRTKRRAPGEREQLEALAAACEERAGDLLDLDQALGKLATLDPGLVEVVDMYFFGALAKDEIAALREVSVRTVERELRAARAWLRRELG